MQKEDIFIRYVHHLADVQARLGNKTAAGLALALHAEQYTWDSKKVAPLSQPIYPEQKSFERKEQLYFEMVAYFEEGAAWDNALESYRELANQYEISHYDLPSWLGRRDPWRRFTRPFLRENGSHFGTSESRIKDKAFPRTSEVDNLFTKPCHLSDKRHSLIECGSCILLLRFYTRARSMKQMQRRIVNTSRSSL